MVRTASFLVKLRSTFTYLARSSIPTISAVSSVALGGGLELALSTHMRVFATSASVGFPEVRLGIIPGAGGSHRLPALIGLPRAQDLILTGRRVSGREAYSLGLCDRLVEVSKSETGDTPDASSARQETLEEALKLAAEICEGAPLATLAALRAMSGWQDSGKTESLVYDDVVRTKDRDEALIAFREKRKPRFEGH